MRKIFILSFVFILPSICLAQIDTLKVEKFIDRVSDTGSLERDEVVSVLNQAVYLPEIIDRMERPAEGMPWYRYRNIFLTDDRIAEGVKFWDDYQQELTKVSYETGVPAHIITAVIGVESFYGKRKGKYRVLDALYTLAFGYPKRSIFFQRELEEFLYLLKEENLGVDEVYGSYAGAIGYCQFMPSSYRAYAVSFDEGNRDLSNSAVDAISSVANYLKVHRWKRGELVASPVTLSSTVVKLGKQSTKPRQTVSYYTSKGYQPIYSSGSTQKASLFEMEQENGVEYWVGYNNFYVITRYNHSSLYALAVYQLAEAIKQSYN